MATEYQDITVHAASFAHQGGPVFYASLPSFSQTRHACQAKRAGDKIRLISFLLDHVGGLEDSFWPNQPLFDRSALPIRVVHGPLGRPHLLRGDVRGPVISFSEGGGKIWAALCGEGSDIGIDVAAADEFQGDYPLHRVFHDQELHHAMLLTGGGLAMAAALLWSIKEAVVKALGCAFHLVAPQQVHILPSIGGGKGYTFRVCLSGKALARYPLDIRSIWVRSYPLARMWLSIALVRGQPRYR